MLRLSDMACGQFAQRPCWLCRVATYLLPPPQDIEAVCFGAH